MKLESNGILIDLRPFGERDMVARIFTADFGVLCGMMRGAQIARKNKPLIGQIGAVANTTVENSICHRDCARMCAESFLLSYSYLRKAFEDNFLR